MKGLALLFLLLALICLGLAIFIETNIPHGTFYILMGCYFFLYLSAITAKKQDDKNHYHHGKM